MHLDRKKMSIFDRCWVFRLRHACSLKKLFESYDFNHQSYERIQTKNASLSRSKTHQNQNLTHDQKFRRKIERTKTAFSK